MKMLINKANPEIRITAPEITLENHCYYIWTDDSNCIIEFWEKDWTLVEEEPKRKQSPALKKIVDNMTEEKLAKTRAEMKIVEEEPEKKIVFELSESEDERIRKFLVDLLSHGAWKEEWSFSPVECVDWLEKQKEPEKLTWEDAQRLWIISKQVMNELDSAKDTFPKWSSSSREMFEEILKRFYEKKGDIK